MLAFYSAKLVLQQQQFLQQLQPQLPPHIEENLQLLSHVRQCSFLLFFRDFFQLFLSRGRSTRQNLVTPLGAVHKRYPILVRGGEVFKNWRVPTYVKEPLLQEENWRQGGGGLKMTPKNMISFMDSPLPTLDPKIVTIRKFQMRHWQRPYLKFNRKN